MDTEISPGEKLDTGGLEIEAIDTPGHAAGHLAFLVNGTDVMTGDVLFKGTVGGTKAPGASGFEDLRASVMRLMELPPETRVHPGHTEPTTIGEEFDANPFVRVWRGLDETGSEEVTVWEQAGDAEALGARLRRRQQGLGRLRGERRGGDRRGLPGTAWRHGGARRRELGRPKVQCYLAPVAKARKVKTKAKCCKSKQRCKRCAVVCKRLEKRGLAERAGKRRYVLLPALTKSELTAARAR